MKAVTLYHSYCTIRWFLLGTSHGNHCQQELDSKLRLWYYAVVNKSRQLELDLTAATTPEEDHF